MQHQGRVHRGANRLQPGNVQAGLGLVHAVLRADGHGQKVRARALEEIRRLGGVGIDHCVLMARLVGQAADAAQFALQPHAHGMGDAGDLRRVFNVVFVALARAVVHDGAKARAQRLHQRFEAIGMVQMHRHGHLRAPRRLQHRRHDPFKRGDGQKRLRRAKNNRRAQLLRRLHTGANHFQIDRVEKSHAVTARLRVGKQFAHRIKRHMASVLSYLPNSLPIITARGAFARPRT